MDIETRDIETTDGIYACIGQAVSGVVRGPWKTVRLAADVHAGSVGLTGLVERPDGRLEGLNVHALGVEVSRAVRNLYRMTAGPYGEAWNRADFELAPGGALSPQFHHHRGLTRELRSFGGK